MRRLLYSVLALLISVTGMLASPVAGVYADSVAHGTAPAVDAPHQSVGLVLSGGGAKGIAHIGVIQALEDNDIPIDFITGTSMGAIVGGLYASGYTPAEMLDLILSRAFSYWSTGKVDPNLRYYFSTPPASPALFTLPIARNDSVSKASAVPASIIPPMPMSFAFMDLFAAYTAQCGGNFNKLFVPFRCVASDASAKHKVVFSKGDLGDAIRASMSFPIIFQPITIDSTLMYDGGIYDNFPVNVMEKDFAPSIMIGVDVSASSKGPQTSLMDQIENLVIQNSDYSLPANRGIKMRIDLNEFSLLDFPRAKEIYQIGYNHAMAMIDSIKERVHSRTPGATRALNRAVFKSHTPYVHFDSVSVYGASPRQNRFIEYIFDPIPTDTFGIEKARRSFYRAISSDMMRDLFPQAVYNKDTGLFTLRLKASVKDNLKAGLGGYITSSTNSFLFLNLGYNTLSFNALSANASAWIGQSYLAGVLKARMVMRTPTPTALSLEAVASREKYYENDYLFFQDKMPTFILDHEFFGRVRYSIAAGSLSSADAGVGVGHLYDSFYRSTSALYADASRDKSTFTLGQAFAHFSHNTLSNINFPTGGAMYDVNLMAVTGRYRLHPVDPLIHPISKHVQWLQAEIRTTNYFEMSRKFSLGLESDILLSTRKLIPDYNSAIIAAPAFHPTPATYNSFNPGLRANSFVAAGLVPVYSWSQNLTTRLGVHAFMPLRRILEDPGTGLPYYGRWLSKVEMFGQFDIAYTLPFGSVSAYCNYSTSPSHNWNVGVSFGVFVLDPKFLR